MRVLLELARGQDPDSWALRHSRGEVPDRWPYGLDRLSAYGLQVVPRPSSRRPFIQRYAPKVDRRLGGFDWVEAFGSGTRAGRGFDAVLAWDERCGVPAVARERVRRGPPVVTGVVWLADRSTANPRGVRLAQTLLPKADMVWVLSTAMVPALSAVYGVAPQRVRYVPMGIDVDFFAATPPADTGLIVSAGNDRHRDHELLVAAFGRLARRNPGVRLTVATRAALEVPPGCPVEVGPRSHGQLRALLAAATVVAVATKPNLHASGLTSVLEGMASGRPVVACDTPGMSEYVTPEAGLLVPPGDPGAFADALGWVLDNPVSAAAMGVAARRRVEEHFTSQAQARRLAALLHETTGRR